MDLPTTVKGTYLLIGLLVAGLFVLFTQTFWGAVLAVIGLAILWYVLYVVGYRADRRVRRGRWEE